MFCNLSLKLIYTAQINTARPNTTPTSTVSPPKGTVNSESDFSFSCDYVAFILAHHLMCVCHHHKIVLTSFCNAVVLAVVGVIILLLLMICTVCTLIGRLSNEKKEKVSVVIVYFMTVLCKYIIVA